MENDLEDCSSDDFQISIAAVMPQKMPIATGVSRDQILSRLRELPDGLYVLGFEETDEDKVDWYKPAKLLHGQLVTPSEGEIIKVLDYLTESHESTDEWTYVLTLVRTSEGKWESRIEYWPRAHQFCQLSELDAK